METTTYKKSNFKVYFKIFCMILVILALGVYCYGYYLFTSMVPKVPAYPQIAGMSSFQVFYDGNEVLLEESQLEEIVMILQDSASRKKISTNDSPNGVDSYYRLQLSMVDSMLSPRFYIFEHEGTVYYEVPYQGVYKVSENVIDILENTDL